MLNKKKFLSLIILRIIILTTGCSNKVINKNSNKNTIYSMYKKDISPNTNKILKELGADNIEIDKSVYEEYIDDKKFAEEKNNKVILDNLPIFILLNQKAKNVTKNSFYAEEICTDTINNIKNIAKTSFENGNLHYEYSKKGKTTFVSVYNKDDDLMYEYDTQKDNLKKLTNFSKKKEGKLPNYNGYFLLQNSLMGNVEISKYNGKKAVHVKFTANMPNVENGIHSNEYWYNTETGLLLKATETRTVDGKKVAHFEFNYNIEFDKSFDKSLFKFDKNKYKK